MKKVGVFYWSGTGNTEAMANAIVAGIEEAGADYDLINVADGAADIAEYETLIFGCPSMGAEELEEESFEPFFAGIEGNLADKKVGLFGSYGWGDGEWMRNWQDRVSEAGAELYNNEGLILNETPDDAGLEECKTFGKEFAM